MALVPQKAGQHARILNGVTKQRDGLGRELAAANQRLTATTAAAAQQAKVAAVDAVQRQQVRQHSV